MGPAGRWASLARTRAKQECKRVHYYSMPGRDEDGTGRDENEEKDEKKAREMETKLLQTDQYGLVEMTLVAIKQQRWTAFELESG